MKRLIMLDEKDGSYYYNYSLVASERNKIHSQSCRECKSGLGKSWFKKRFNRDLWLGPFETKEQALEKILSTFNKKAEYHDCCKND